MYNYKTLIFKNDQNPLFFKLFKNPHDFNFVQNRTWTSSRGIFNEFQDKNLDWVYRNNQPVCDLQHVTVSIDPTSKLNFFENSIQASESSSLDQLWQLSNDEGYVTTFDLFGLGWRQCSDLVEFFTESSPNSKLIYSLFLPVFFIKTSVMCLSDSISMGLLSDNELFFKLNFVRLDHNYACSILNAEDSDPFLSHSHKRLFHHLINSIDPYVDSRDGTAFYATHLAYRLTPTWLSCSEPYFIRGVFWNIFITFIYLFCLDTLFSIFFYKLIYSTVSLKLYIVCFALCLFIYIWTKSNVLKTFKDITFKFGVKGTFYGLHNRLLDYEHRWELGFWWRYPRRVYVAWRVSNWTNWKKKYNDKFDKFFTIKPYFISYKPVYNTIEIRIYQKVVLFFKKHYLIFKDGLINPKTGMSSYIFIPYNWAKKVIYVSLETLRTETLAFCSIIFKRYGIYIKYFLTLIGVFYAAFLVYIFIEYSYLNGNFYYTYTNLKTKIYYFNYVIFWQVIIPLVYCINIFVYLRANQYGTQSVKYVYMFFGFLWLIFIVSILYLVMGDVGQNTFPNAWGKKISKFSICLFLFILLYTNYYILLFLQYTLKDPDRPHEHFLYKFNRWYNLTLPYGFGYIYLCFVNADNVIFSSYCLVTLFVYKIIYSVSLWWVEGLLFGNRSVIYMVYFVIVGLYLYNIPIFMFLDNLYFKQQLTVSHANIIEFYLKWDFRGMYLENFLTLFLPSLAIVFGSGYTEYLSVPKKDAPWRQLRAHRSRGVWFGTFVVDTFILILLMDLRLFFCGMKVMLYFFFSFVLFIIYRDFWESINWRTLNTTTVHFLPFSLHSLLTMPSERLQLFLVAHVLITACYVHLSLLFQILIKDSETRPKQLFTPLSTLAIKEAIDSQKNFVIKRWFKYFYCYLFLAPFFIAFPLIPLADVVMYGEYIKFPIFMYYAQIIHYLPIIFVYWVNVYSLYFTFFTASHLYNEMFSQHWIPLWAVHLSNFIFFLASAILAWYFLWMFVHADTQFYLHWKNPTTSVLMDSPEAVAFGLEAASHL